MRCLELARLCSRSRKLSTKSFNMFWMSGKLKNGIPDDNLLMVCCPSRVCHVGIAVLHAKVVRGPLK